jgi:hypothetical protein
MVDPIVTGTAQSATNAAGQTVSASADDTGHLYLVLAADAAGVTSAANIYALPPEKWAHAAVSTVNTPVAISTEGLTAGTYKLFAVDSTGNLSSVGTNNVTITGPNTPLKDATFESLTETGGNVFTNPTVLANGSDATPDIKVHLVDVAVGDQVELWVDGQLLSSHTAVANDVTAQSYTFVAANVQSKDTALNNTGVVGLEVKVFHAEKLISTSATPWLYDYQ